MRMNKSYRSPKSFWHFAIFMSFGLWLILGVLTANLLSQRLPFYNILEYGAKADGKTVNTSGNQSSY